MLHPSYSDLMNRINDRNDDLVIKSRYSIVIATSKRARELIGGDEPLVVSKITKPVSNAVNELYAGKIDIV
jgi:DNA-directed RNA polymerase subunit omega